MYFSYIWLKMDTGTDPDQQAFMPIGFGQSFADPTGSGSTTLIHCSTRLLGALHYNLK
jgi:hypothetical protein